MIFTEEVIWFCEDCKVVDTESSEKGEVDSSEDFVTVADPISALAFISFLGMKGKFCKYKSELHIYATSSFKLYCLLIVSKFLSY